MEPSAWAELEPYPVLRELFALQIDMQFADVRVLLRLPELELELELEGGCNLALAALLFNLISGASVLFYNASVGSITERGNRGQRFKGLLRDYYPWSTTYVLPREQSVDLLWEGGRHPLIHSLGIGPTKTIALPGSPEIDGTPITVVYGKSALTKDQIEAVVTSRTTPFQGTLWLSESNRVTVSVPTLAWGVHEMLRRLFADEVQAIKAERAMKEVRDGP